VLRGPLVVRDHTCFTPGQRCRGAASPQIKVAQQACCKEETAAERRATRKDLESQYLRKYSEYRQLTSTFSGTSVHAKEAERAVKLMDELNDQAKQLLCGSSSLSPLS
jgi:hypothetical protein